MISGQTRYLKFPSRAKCNAGRRKNGVVIAPQPILPEICNPVRYNPPNFIPYWEEEGRETLTELGFDLTRILMDAVRVQINVLELHRGNGAISGSSEEGECDK